MEQISNNGSTLNEQNGSALPNQQDEIIDFEYSTQMMCEVLTSIEHSSYPQEITLTEVEWD